MAAKAHSVSFEVTEEGKLLVAIGIKYFTEVESFKDLFSRKINPLIERRELLPDDIAQESTSLEELLAVIRE